MINILYIILSFVGAATFLLSTIAFADDNDKGSLNCTWDGPKSMGAFLLGFGINGLIYLSFQ